MKAAFHYELVNDPFGDPGLYVLMRFERRALLFDLGDIRRLASRQVLAIEHVFISHTHIDHFSGFDDLLRICLGRPLKIHFYGPPGLIAQVEHKLAAYTWNLVQNYETDFTLVVAEFDEANGQQHRAQFRCQTGFARDPLPSIPLQGDVLMRDHRIQVRAATLDHRIPCLGFCVEETTHVAVMKNRLGELGLEVGPWLQGFKRALLDAAPDDTVISGPAGQPLRLGDLRARCVFTSPGPKLGYITDVAFHAHNTAKITALVQGADILFIESSFTADEAQRAADRAHLTTHQAGTLGRLSGVKRVIPFHFSPRHAHQAPQMYAEVQAAFENDLVVTVPADVAAGAGPRL